MTLRAIILSALVAFSSTSIVKSPSDDTFELLILHNNDMHARFEQTSQLSGACTVADRDAGKCYGGFPRVATVVKEARRAAASGQGPPVLYLNAGDTYTGTAWFTIYKWKIAAEFLNALEPDAVSLGNNDFEKGTSKLSPFLEDLRTTVLASNVIINSEEAKQKIKTSVILNIGKVNVGIVGYLTPDTNILDSTANVEYIDEILALEDEVNKLQSEGVNIIVALGHTDLKKNVEIASAVEGIDMIINGYQNSFFWNGTSADINEDVLQPIVVTQSSGKQVPIVQSYAYNKYLGKILTKFNADGDIIEYNVNPILLDTSIPQNTEATVLVQSYDNDIKSTSEVVGNTAVVLDGESCRLEECNFGNLVLDSIVYYYAIRFEGERWTDAAIAIAPSSTFASTISPSNRPSAVTRGDLLAAMPESENLVTVTMNGTILMSVLERSVENFRWNNPSGQFLQFSGIRVVYDFAKDPGERVVSAVVRCWNCFVPEFYEINDWRDYKILMPASLANGQHGYSMLVDLPRENLAYDAVTCTSEFIQLRSPVYPEVAGRITLVNTESVPDSASKLRISMTIVLPLLAYFVYA